MIEEISYVTDSKGDKTRIVDEDAETEFGGDVITYHYRAWRKDKDTE